VDERKRRPGRFGPAGQTLAAERSPHLAAVKRYFGARRYFSRSLSVPTTKNVFGSTIRSYVSSDFTNA
jgi:hypothetical protein